MEKNIQLIWITNFYTGINENIKKIDRQVIILLDDLDRLEKPEILKNMISATCNLPIPNSWDSGRKSVFSANFEKTASASWNSVMGQDEKLTGADWSLLLLFLVMTRIGSLKSDSPEPFCIFISDSFV